MSRKSHSTSAASPVRRIVPDSSSSSHVRPRNMKQEEEDVSVPITYEGTAFSLHSSKKGKTKPKMEGTSNKKIDQSAESEPIEMSIDDKFSYYINRAKLKIRTVSSAGGGKSGNEKDPVNGRFTDYIKRAKIRLQKTTTMTEGKNFPKNEKP